MTGKRLFLQVCNRAVVLLAPAKPAPLRGPPSLTFVRPRRRLTFAPTTARRGRRAHGVSYPQVQQGTVSLIYNRTSAATPLAGPTAKPAYFWTDALGGQAAWELDF